MFDFDDLDEKEDTPQVEELTSKEGTTGSAPASCHAALEGPRPAWVPPSSSSRRRRLRQLPPFQPLGKERGEAPGEWYGLHFPIGLKALRKAGPRWLTKAFHAAGTLPASNFVEAITRWSELPTSGPELAGGAGVKVCFSVRYARPDPELHESLFCKMPWPFSSGSDGPRPLPGAERISGDDAHRAELSNGLWGRDGDALELSAHVFLEPLLPVRTPKCYFADISRRTTNYILITEQIPFGSLDCGSKRSILPAVGKYYDCTLRNPEEYYYALFAAQARIAGYDKLGRYNEHAEVFSPWPPKAPGPVTAQARRMRGMTAKRAAESGSEFASTLAPLLFPADAREPAFLERLVGELAFCGQYAQDIANYQMADLDYVALVHANLCVDNAFFWRDEGGLLDCGLIDWFATGRTPFGMNLWMCLIPAPPETFAGHVEGLCRCFAAEYARHGGPAIPADALLERLYLAMISQVALAGGGLATHVFPRVRREAWPDIEHFMDERVQSDILVRCVVLNVIHGYTSWARNDFVQLLKAWLVKQHITEN
mmetsp:Transcript_58812/g.164223  ORF Transcript_58812/g.164223 Transcript_58812/m.164223 type:complete len:541 (+) Transcript_58812:148-1770(+)